MFQRQLSLSRRKKNTNNLEETASAEIGAKDIRGLWSQSKLNLIQNHY
jgi:hypothetical protein